jgi:hypothetical protein
MKHIHEKTMENEDLDEHWMLGVWDLAQLAIRLVQHA